MRAMPVSAGGRSTPPHMAPRRGRRPVASRFHRLFVIALLLALTTSLVAGRAALAQDTTSLVRPDAYPPAITVNSQQYSFDRPMEITADQLTDAGTDGDVQVYLPQGNAGDVAFGQVADGPIVRYLASHPDDPNATCATSNLTIPTLTANNTTYIPEGLEPTLTENDLTALQGSTVTINGNDDPVYALPNAESTPAEIWAGTSDGLQRFVAGDSAGLPPQLTSEVVVGNLSLTNPVDATSSVNQTAQTFVGCAGPFVVAQDDTDPTIAYIVAGDHIFAFDAVTQQGGTPAAEPSASASASPAASSTRAVTPRPISTATTAATETATPVPPTDTATATATATTIPPTETVTATATATAAPPTATVTATSAPPTETVTATAAPPTATATAVPPTATAVPPTATAVSQTATAAPTTTPAPSTTPLPSTAPPTATAPATATATSAATAPAAATSTATAVSPAVPATTAATATAPVSPTPAAPTATTQLAPPAVVPTIPAGVTPAAATVAATTCSGPTGAYAADGNPELLPRLIQLSGTAYRLTGPADAAASGTLTRIGCVGAFTALVSDQAPQSATLFLQVPMSAATAGHATLFRFDVGTTFTVQAQSTDRPALILSGTTSYTASQPWVRASFSSVTVALFVPDGNATTPPNLIYARNLNGNSIGAYSLVGADQPTPDANVADQATATGLNSDLTIGDQQYVLTAVFVPAGTTTNGFVTIYAESGNATPDRLLGVDPRDPDLLIYDRSS